MKDFFGLFLLANAENPNLFLLAEINLLLLRKMVLLSIISKVKIKSCFGCFFFVSKRVAIPYQEK